MKRSKRNREDDKKGQDEEKESKEWKNKNNLKGGNEDHLENQIFLVLFFTNKSREI